MPSLPLITWCCVSLPDSIRGQLMCVGVSGPRGEQLRDSSRQYAGLASHGPYPGRDLWDSDAQQVIEEPGNQERADRPSNLSY